MTAERWLNDAHAHHECDCSICPQLHAALTHQTSVITAVTDRASAARIRQLETEVDRLEKQLDALRRARRRQGAA